MWLGIPDANARVGNIRLAPHQVAAIAPIQSALREFGGAFLCDVVGSGKTYIGLAVAGVQKNSVIIAPASLREMWMGAIGDARVRARFVTIESLSRGTRRIDEADLLVIDEAHHFRNSSTKRYRHLAALVRGRPILLMTATPIHNSRADLETLASLFLGSRARHLSDAELSRLIIRRKRNQILSRAPIPRVAATEWLDIGDDPVVAAAVMGLPPPIPPRDAGEAESLASHGLIRQWASSEAALKCALQRRLARARALEASLESGHYPSEVGLRSWLGGEDSTQLCFAALFAPSGDENGRQLLAAVRTHSSALRELFTLAISRERLDENRAGCLRAISARHPNALIVAFSSYEATIRMLFQKLNMSSRVAALTARGGQVAGGRVSRSEIIGQFSPSGVTPRLSDRIELLLTTDLLSEGVNLQKAMIVVHLDLPWTPARVEQRVGRIARLGSPHAEVCVYGISPPPSAEAVLRTSVLLGEKWLAAAAALGQECVSGFETPSLTGNGAPPEACERMRETISAWSRKGTRRSCDTGDALVAAVFACHEGFVAALEQDGRSVLLCSDGAAIFESPAALERACRAASGAPASATAEAVALSLQLIKSRMTAQDANECAGLGSSAHLRTRRRLLARLDSIAARLALHARPLGAHLIKRARIAATSTHDAGREEQLATLGAGRRSLNDDLWLEQVAEVGSRADEGGDNHRSYRVRALLLFVKPIPPPAS